MFQKNDQRAALSCVCVWVLLSLSGCGELSNRQSLKGTVTLDGVLLAEGHITFLPQPGTKGPTTGGKITKGHFSISPEGGAFVGTFRVEITATRKTDKKIKDPIAGKMIDNIEQFLPRRYNRQSELMAEVTEAGPNRFEFALTSE